MARLPAVLLVLLLIPLAQAHHGRAGFSDTDVFEGDYETTGPWAKTLRPGDLPVRDLEVVSFPSSIDEEDIAIGFVRPDAPGRFPVLVRATPYLAADMATTLPDDFEWQMRVQFVPHGYVMAFIPTRGTGDAGGCMELLGRREVADLEQAVEWLANQPWSNGNIGVMGLSYDAATAWALAATGNPHVKTIVPLAGAGLDAYQYLYPNGTDNLGATWAPVYYGLGFASEVSPLYPNLYRSPEHRVSGALCPEVVDALPATAHASLGYGRNEFWQERDFRARILENYQGSVFLVQGLRDLNTQPSLPMNFARQLDESGVTVKWLLGQWGHAFPDVDPATRGVAHPHVRWDWAEMQLHWYDHYLKQRPSDLGPHVEVQDTTGQWRADAFWPADVDDRTLQLRADGTLGATDGLPASRHIAGYMSIGPTVVVGGSYYEQGYSEATCASCAVFAGQPYGTDTIIVGTPRFDLTITPLTTEGTIGAWLLAERDGVRRFLGSGGADVHYANPQSERTTVVPGRTMQATIQLEPLEARVNAGERLVLVVHAGNWLVFHSEAMPYKLHVGAGASRMHIQEIPASERRAFDPPAGPGTASVDPPTFTDTDVFPGDYNKTKPWSQVLDPGMLAMRAPETHTEPSLQDLVDLSVTFVRPDAPGRFPVLVRASPYLQADLANNLHLDPEYGMRIQFVPKGYVVAYVPVRGTGDAGGCLEQLSDKELADLEQIVDWLAAQPWSNGKIGVIGLSYDGSTAWALAASGNPHIKTIVTMSAHADLYEWLYTNGEDGLNSMPAAGGVMYTYGFAPEATDPDAVMLDPSNTTAPLAYTMSDRPLSHRIEGAACPHEAELAAATLEASAGMGRTAYWQERDRRAEVIDRYEGSVLMVNGLRDYNVFPSQQLDMADDLTAHGIPVKMLLGQWDHAFPDIDPKTWQPHANARWDWAEIQLHWYDYWLKGRRNVDLGPRVQVQDTSGQWSSATHWAPADAAAATWNLSQGNVTASPTVAEDLPVVGTLANGLQYFATGASSIPEGYYGETSNTTCLSCPTFRTEYATAPWNLVGAPHLLLNVTPTTPEGTVGAWLFLEQNGTSRLVGIGGVNMLFADGSETPTAVVPGMPTIAHVTLQPLDVHVPAGARLALVIHAGGSYGYSTHPSPFILHTQGSSVSAQTLVDDGAAGFTPP